MALRGRKLLGLLAVSVAVCCSGHLTAADDARLLSQHWQRAQDAERFSQAEKLADQMVASSTTAGQKADAWCRLARSRAAQGRAAEAEQAYRAGLKIPLGAGDPANADLPYRLGLLYLSQKKYAEAEPLLQQALAFYEREPTISKNESAAVLYELGVLEHDRQDYPRSEGYHRRAVELRRGLFGEEHAQVGVGLALLADLARHQKQYDRAAELFEQSIAILEKTAGPEHPLLALALNEQGEYYRERNDYAAAEAVHRRRLEICQKRYWAGDVRVLRAAEKLVFDLEKQGQQQLAAKELERVNRGRFARPRAEIVSNSATIRDASNKELLKADKGSTYFVRRIEKPYYIVETPLQDAKPDGWILQKDARLIGGPSSPPPVWNRFHPPQSRFSIELPASPFHSLTTGSGIVSDVYSVQTDGVLYRAAYHERVADLDRQEGVNALAEVLNGKLQRQHDLEIAGRPGFEFDIALADGSLLRVRNVTVDQIVYEFSALAEPGLIDSADVKRFLNSFKLP